MDKMQPQRALLNLNQFADDGKIYPASAAQVRTFKQVMDQFALITNQQLNHQKTKLIPIGDIPHSLPASIDDFSLVDSAKFLGITIHAGTSPPTYPWEDKMEMLSTIAKILKVQNDHAAGYSDQTEYTNKVTATR
jgi:hypothetical protein